MPSDVSELYKIVINDVAREEFLYEHLSEDFLRQFKEKWEENLLNNKTGFIQPIKAPLHQSFIDDRFKTIPPESNNDQLNYAEDIPLNANDDLSDSDDEEGEDCENIVVCQCVKIEEFKDIWKLRFKSGIMSVLGKDYVFQRLWGGADWSKKKNNSN